MRIKALVIALALLALISLWRSPPMMAVPTTPCPISLTNPDGQALTLEKYDLRVAVNGPLSLTEMEMTFRNPEKRQMEGRFLYLLPPGATISRFAKEVNGTLMEGEVVERMRAQSVYTQILHTMRDPALLEMDQGNRFSARVFPIPANGTVRLLLSYSQMAPMKNGERKLTIPLAGLPKIGDFSVSVDIREAEGAPEVSSNIVKALNVTSGRASGNFKSGEFTSQTDFELTIKPASAGKLGAIQAGNFQMLSFAAPAASKKVIDHLDKIPDWVFYFDTSASNADIEKQRLDTVATLLNALEKNGPVSKAFAFDVSVAALSVASNSQNRSPMELAHQLRSCHALGATNLEAVMKHLGEQARAAKDPQRFVLVSDGIATLGAREPREVLAALGEWPAQHVLHALVIGSKQDEKMLAAIVEKTNGRVVTLPFSEEMDTQVAKTISELTEPLGITYEFYDEGAAWIYPKVFRDVRPGSELVVFSQLKEGAQSKAGVVTREVGQKVVDTNLKVEPIKIPDFAPLLQREANAAFISHLDKLEQAESDAKKRDELRKQRLDVSVKNRVLCPLTSLLVLETEWDYQRFGIERTTLADILTIGANGIELKHRQPSEIAQAQAKTPREPAKLSKPAMKAEPAKDGKFDAEAKELEDKSKSTDALGLQQAWHEGQGQGSSSTSSSGGSSSTSSSSGDMDLGGGGGDLVLEGGRFDSNANGVRERQLTTAATGSSSGGGGSMDGEVADDRTARANNPHPTAQSATAAPFIETGRAEAARPEAPAPEARRVAVAGGLYKSKAPAWVEQLNQIPTKDQIAALHAQVSANPRDRGLRNAYAQALLISKKWDELQGQAFEWMPFDPENPQVYEYLGKSATGLKDSELALRAMTSIAEIAPNRAALLARAGWLLLTAEKFEMAQQMFREALKNRQDDCNIYRGLALALWLDGKHEDSAKVLSDAIGKDFDRRYGDTRRVLKEELGYVLRAWAAAGSLEAAEKIAQKADVMHQLKHFDALRVTMCWETDANDVDLHVADPSGEECWYSHKQNASGLELYSDQTQGLGPEVIRTERALEGTYSIAVNYFAAGPMGVSRGVVVTMEPNAEGVVTKPMIVPFCLIPGGPDMRLIGTANFGKQ